MVWAFVAVFAVATLMDLVDRRHRRVRRSSSEMLRRRRDERADAWSTQHSGYAQFPQHDRAVRSDLDARSDLRQLRGPLQYNRLDTVVQQRQSGGEPTNASSNNYDFHAKFLQLG